MARIRFASLLAAMLWAAVPIASGIVLAPPPAHGQSQDLIELDKRVRALRDAGKYAEAIPLAEQLVKRVEAQLGKNHAATAAVLNTLANLYSRQGRTADAEQLSKRSLAIREKALGAEHPDVAASLNNLAILNRAQGRYADAEPLDRRSLAIREKALGAEHPDVATSLNNLASL